MSTSELGEVVETDYSTLTTINKAEIDMQIATAHRFPRSVKRFRSEALDMVTLTEEIAQECIYALPRDGKTIEGPSARFAEIVASAWGNCRAGARVVSEDKEFVTAQGVFHDLERNVAITYEVKRRITDRNGRRYKPDMVAVTANAACSISLRNAILKGVPKAFWKDVYDSARKTVMGDTKTLANRRAEAVAYLQKFGATPDMICQALGVAGVEDIGLDELVTLRGLATAIKDGDTTVEQAFSGKSYDDSKAKEVLDRFNNTPRAPQESMHASEQGKPDQGHTPSPEDEDEPITDAQLKKLNTCFSSAEIKGDDRLGWLKVNCGVKVASTKDLTKTQAHEAIDKLEMRLEEMGRKYCPPFDTKRGGKTPGISR